MASNAQQYLVPTLPRGNAYRTYQIAPSAGWNRVWSAFPRRAWERGKMTELSSALYSQMQEAEKLDKVIRKNLEVLGYGG